MKGSVELLSRAMRAIDFEATILDKTVEKILYLDSIFLNIVAVQVLPSPPSPEGFLSAKASFWK